MHNSPSSWRLRPNMWLLAVPATLLMAAFTVCAVAQPSGTFAIRNVRIFDGTQTIPRGTVLVSGGKIAAVGTNISLPAGTEIVEGAGKTLLPGLIDSHVHMADAYQTSGGLVLEQAAVYGVTTVLDMGVSSPDDYPVFRRKVKAGEFPMGADLFTSGVGATVPNGHGDMRHLNPTLISPDEAQAWVDARIAAGSDYIKIFSETFEEHNRKVPTLSDETIVAVIAAAHKRGMLTVVHTLQQARAKRAISAGADILVHISPYDAPDADFGKFAAEHHIAHSTNLISYAPPSIKAGLAADPDLAAALPPFMIEELKTARPFPDAKHEYSMAAFRQLTAAGVPILAGTDIGFPYAPLIHAELELMVRDGGMTPADALKTATANPADRYPKLLANRGRIKPGLQADLLLVNGDPTQKITATRSIAAVWRQGVRIDREAYQAKLPAMKAPERPPMPGGPAKK